LGHEDDALPVLRRAAELVPDEPWILLNLGIAWRRNRDLGAAVRQYRRALALRPDYGAAQIALGNALRRQGKLKEAIAILSRTASRGGNEERARALVWLGRAYLSAERGDDAARAFEKAVERAPAVAEIRVSVARGYLGAGNTDRAIAVLRDTVRLAPEVHQVHSALAYALEKKGDKPGAEAAYARAVSLDPSYRHARRRLFRLALDAQDFPRARMQVEYLLQNHPDVPEHNFLAGLLAGREGKHDAAKAHYLTAIDKTGGDYPAAYFNLGRLEKRAGNLDRAIAA
jgi:tetratricopeptide (TPR) repeat protein